MNSRIEKMEKGAHMVRSQMWSAGYLAVVATTIALFFAACGGGGGDGGGAIIGSVSTLAGTAGSAGATDNTGAAARFNKPTGITTDGTNLYVTDTDSHTIRRIVIATGAVSTIAGTAGSRGSADGTGAAARFQWPFGIATDGTNLYVADTGNHKIRKVVIATGAVSTFAGTGTGSTDGPGLTASFVYPYGITRHGTSLYVADTGNNTIREILIATGDVSTLAGTAGAHGSTDNTGTAARFYYPYGIASDGTNVYVVDSANSTIRKIAIATRVVSTLAGTVGVLGSTDGAGTAASFNFSLENGITTDGTNLYLTDNANHTIRKIAIATGAVSTLAGTAGSPGATDNTGAAARFNKPIGITTNGTDLYVSDTYNHTIRRID